MKTGIALAGGGVDTFSAEGDDNHLGTALQKLTGTLVDVGASGGGNQFLCVGRDDRRVVVAGLEKGIAVGVDHQGGVGGTA